MPDYPCDLHLHTTRSDGADSPAELLDRAATLGLAVAAITDHDIRPPDSVSAGGRELGIHEYAASLGITVLRGIEISCETGIEDTHIVGFGCDWHDPYFADLETAVVRSKKDSYVKLVAALRKDGMDLTWDDVLANNGNAISEEAVQKKMIFELIAKKGYAATWAEAKRLVNATPAYRISREKPSATAVIRAIRDTGGISILAHPYLIADAVEHDGHVMGRTEFIRRLIAAGLDGIEAVYTYDKTSYGGGMTKQAIAREVVETFGNAVRIVSGGSDYHGDWRKGAVNPREMGEAGISLEYFQENDLLRRVVGT
ncbi:MAG: PHP domain-containing protein [Planctomycetes bacterium]|nr:PHP domain-containing protein [Planctomycetota bacterium]MCD7895949.1 PHP domain-containing protein [Planctomycetaceae bacterium]